MTNKELATLSFEIGSNEYAVAKHLYDTMKPLPIEIICYLCQQATEKSIKAVLYHLEKEVLETHSIIKLLEDVNSDKRHIHLGKRDAAMITRFATRTRYAERRIDVAKEDAEFALRRAQQTLEQAEKILGEGEEPQAQS
ncbi:MAG: HEPN domain-containing protein [Defluviitaleaceae bacterium]|nr:HEPN domain-containing protein [Defluviitaleaceae bacterium]